MTTNPVNFTLPVTCEYTKMNYFITYANLLPKSLRVSICLDKPQLSPTLFCAFSLRDSNFAFPDIFLIVIIHDNFPTSKNE